MGREGKNTAIYIGFDDYEQAELATPEKNLLRAILLNAVADINRPGDFSRRARDYFMSKEDRKYFDSLPEQVVVYRGYLQGKNKTGFSYTLNKERAEWFANRFSGDGKVYERTVRKDKIVAYTNRRDEQEVIILS